ncbi:MAG: beta-galactosidase [Armatimonadota bacterium]
MRLFVLICVLVMLCGAAYSSALVPVIANPGFEEVVPGNDAPGWGWYVRTASASFRSSTDAPHSGTRCMVFTNGSGLQPEVYGRMHQGVGVMPSTTYELSVWVRGKEVADGLHFTDWGAYTLNIPSGTYGWRKLTATFKTSDAQTSLNLGINIVNKCKELAIDDISIRATGVPFSAPGISGALLIPGQVIGDNKNIPLFIHVSSAVKSPVTLDVSIADGKNLLFSKSMSVSAGESDFELQWNTGQTANRNLKCRIRLTDTDGKLIKSASFDVEKTSAKVILADIDKIESRLKEFDSLAAKCRAKNIPIDYPMVARTMLEQFIPLARNDALNGEERRAAYSVRDFVPSLDNAIAEMKVYLSNPRLAPNARRYQTSPVEINGGSFIGETVDTRGVRDRNPVFFCGYGHFGQIGEDMPRWPGYGVNIVQYSVFGPSAVFPSENEVSMKEVETLKKLLDDAAKNNVRVDFLISPHYFPDWAFKKWPHLAKGGGGFLPFCVAAPEAKQVIEKYLKIVIPEIKDKPALHSICLTNEPILDREAGCDEAKIAWAGYLADVYNTVDVMNNRYGTSYKSFDEVPIPGNASYQDPQFYDWCVFNQERFAWWHRWMADIIHEIAPGIPIHAKAMWTPVSWRNSVTWGIDPELFNRFSDINGNDCTIWPGDSYWGISWMEQNMYFDLQRSMGLKPVFNSENHLQTDGSTYYVAPEHYRTALWQGAVHGQGATTIWVWERSVPGSPSTYPFYGNVMDRPGCAQAVGTTCLDLNRFSEEVTAVQNVQAPVAIFYSIPSYARQDNFINVLRNAYAALNFCGIKVEFISEKQLAAGNGSRYRMIVLPDTTHMTDAAFSALWRLGSSTRLVFIGESGAFDPYNHPRSADFLANLRKGALCLKASASPEKDLWPAFLSELERLGVLPEVSVTDAKTGKPVWGVEWLPAKVGDRTVVNIVNLRAVPKDVNIKYRGNPVEARDLLSLGGKSKIRRLKPITPVLAEIVR